MYNLTDDQKFEMENFQNLKTFSSFLPGIAGVDGIPMWVFYVNRGQGIASFGIQDKDHAMMEFFPADKSYQYVQVQGFRTFLKLTYTDDSKVFLEPFSSQSKTDESVHEKMTVSENILELQYTNNQAGIDLSVQYFILPEAPVGGLVRHVKVKNMTEELKNVEILDGLPTIFPSGVPNSPYKELGNTIKSWFDVTNLDENIPFYRLRGSIEDSSEVKEIHQGNFYVSFAHYRNEDQQIQPIIDREVIFGSDSSLQVPERFLNGTIQELKEAPQQTTNKVSGGFSPLNVELLESNEEVELYTVVGHAKNLNIVTSYVKEQISRTTLAKKKEVATTITEGITKKIETKTGNPLFDAYSRQSYLDNGLRGGFPITFEKNGKHKVYYLFSRKHGDLERDYNFFSISPTYYSQGNGNYRDINQNRRCDIYFEPKVGDYNVQLFMNLIQLDGYNPLSVKGVTFFLKDPNSLDLSQYISNGEEKLKSFFDKSFTPGDLKHFIEDEQIQLNVPFEDFLTIVLLQAEEAFQAEFGEGYWIDHWTYNLDLIDSYLGVFPDKAAEFFFQRPYRYFESPVRVKKRIEKYVITSNSNLRQYHANEKIKEKVEMAENNNGVLWIRKNYGEGDYYKTNLYSKLFLLSLVKATTMAPLGLGIEMEGDKPGWNDSLNGLPGMFGASTSELFELKRLTDLLLTVEQGGTLSLPVEGAEFLTKTVEAMKQVDSSSEKSEFHYWDKITTYREDYREKIYHGLSGEEVEYSLNEAKRFLQVFKERIEKGIERVNSYSDPLIPTYFYFEPKGDLREVPEDFSAIEWLPKPVTPFLEGVVKQLKLTDSKMDAKKLYEKVKESKIYDQKLNMYKTSMSIADEPSELGRAKSFTPGWLENESIFLHMEYKYLLALLKAGLYDEYFEDMQKAMIPFLEPNIYGRSTLENSSFIASSANPDPALHGRGFVARLSGSTIEFMNMWVVLMAGSKPFVLKNDQLACQLSPTLPGWLFDEKGEVSFTFLGSTEVTYVNEQKGNTYGEGAVVPTDVRLEYVNGEEKALKYSELVGNVAEDIRNGKLKKITVTLTK